MASSRSNWMKCSGVILGLAVFVAATAYRVNSQDSSRSGGGYRNPILFSDYSDPDVIRDGNHFYMVASSFHFVPGIPILESPDLVHWTILGHVLPRLDMDPRYDLQGSDGYAKGVWAPAIRKHNNLFYIYFPTPTEGIFVVTAKTINGPWSKPVAVIRQAELEDPCPFWERGWLGVSGALEKRRWSADSPPHGCGWHVSAGRWERNCPRPRTSANA
jgi:beta-xylosidase